VNAGIELQVVLLTNELECLKAAFPFIEKALADLTVEAEKEGSGEVIQQDFKISKTVFSVQHSCIAFFQPTTSPPPSSREVSGRARSTSIGISFMPWVSKNRTTFSSFQSGQRCY
jgi:hypothetical protein